MSRKLQIVGTVSHFLHPPSPSIELAIKPLYTREEVERSKVESTMKTKLLVGKNEHLPHTCFTRVHFTLEFST